MFNVLIVDDDPFILDGLKYIIDWQSLGLEIVGTANNGKTASEFIQNHIVDVLLADIKMPEMDGIELIRWIRKNQFDIKCVILSGYDDYQYMKQAITLDIENYLIKSVNEDELTETLKNIVEKLESRHDADHLAHNSILKGNVLYRWVNGKIGSREFQERSELLNIDVNKASFMVSILRVSQKHPEQSHQYNLNDVTSFLEKSIELHPTEVTPLFFQDLDGDYVFIFSDNSTEIDKIGARNYMLSVATIISSKPGLTFFISSGSCSAGYSTVSVSYTSAKMLMDYSVMLPDNQYIDMQTASKYRNLLDKVSDVDFAEFRNLLLNGGNDAAIEFVDNIYVKAYDISQYAPDFLKNAALKLLFSLLDTANYLNLDISLIIQPSEAIYEKISMFKTGHELHLWIKTLVSKFFTAQRGEETYSSPLIQRVINYVKVNYNKDISLKLLSFEFNVNTAYLGRAFKEEKNQAFSSYLNHVRVEKAKEMLINTNYSVNEIAVRVGYSNSNYFISVFKKFTGYFPSNYRK